ncbi:MAG TPA: hypothetical protein VE130_16740 [Nitrososphaeraceae archaeon]|nr:hypothetical protein [Nitrososphaeraceae archaeon]
MLNKQSVVIIAIVTMSLALGAAGLVTAIGQVAYAQDLIEYPLISF